MITFRSGGGKGNKAISAAIRLFSLLDGIVYVSVGSLFGATLYTFIAWKEASSEV